MDHTRESPKTTTVCVDAGVRDYIAEEAERQGLSQRQVTRHIVEAYKRLSENPADSSSAERITGFIRQQEKMFLSPILKTVQDTDAKLKVLIEILKEME